MKSAPGALNQDSPSSRCALRAARDLLSAGSQPGEPKAKLSLFNASGDRLLYTLVVTNPGQIAFLLPNVNATPLVLLSLWTLGKEAAVFNFSTMVSSDSTSSPPPEPPWASASISGVSVPSASRSSVAALASAAGFVIENARAYGFWFATQLTLGQWYTPRGLRDFGVGGINGALWTITTEIIFYQSKPEVIGYFDQLIEQFHQTQSRVRVRHDATSNLAVGLAVAIAIASAWKDREVPTDVVAVGELGLAGELRRVRDLPQRLAEEVCPLPRRGQRRPGQLVAATHVTGFPEDRRRHPRRPAGPRP